MKVHNCLERLRKKAGKSICRYRIAAIGFDRQHNPLCIKFNAPGYNKKGGGVHAEINVLKHCGKNLYRIIIARVSAAGDFLPIEPCEVCRCAMMYRGIIYETVGVKK